MVTTAPKHALHSKLSNSKHLNGIVSNIQNYSINNYTYRKLPVVLFRVIIRILPFCLCRLTHFTAGDIVVFF